MKILKAKDKVKGFLTNLPHLRDDDNKLIASVWFEELKDKGYEPQSITAFMFLKILADGKLTNAESIRRCRAKFQETNPALRGKIYAQRHKEKIVVNQQLKSFL